MPQYIDSEDGSCRRRAPTGMKRRIGWIDIASRLSKDRWLYLMMVPGLLYFIVFKYVPMWGIVISFQEYRPFFGVAGSEWVGLRQYERLFSGNADFLMLLTNTAALSILQLLFAFPVPIVVALLLSELRSRRFQRTLQTLINVPHFMSWVIIVGMFYVIFEMGDGLVQTLLGSVGRGPVSFMLDPDMFRPLYIMQILWRDTGWNCILYMAALAGVDLKLYEAARIDGAGRWLQLLHVTLPSIRSTIVILLILKLGDFLELGFEHVYLLLNPLNRDVAEIFDTFVYEHGIKMGQFSYSSAVGVFKASVGLLLVLGANRLAKRFGEDGLI